jgi:Gas vesicle synthesis protein GvpL/GvpF
MTTPDGDPLVAIARPLADDVLAEATARARELATARLAELIAEAIVTEALGALPRPAATVSEPERDEAPDQSHDEEPQETAEVLYAYGITRAGSRPPEDVDVPVDLVHADDLGLLVSRARPEELRVDADDLSEGGRLAVLARRHDAVVRSAVAAGPVLPLRFGTVVPDEDAARRLLRDHGDLARARLDRIGNAREWGVRLVRTLPAEPATAGAATGEQVTGTEYLSRRREALHERDDAAREAAHGAELLEQTLAPHVTASMRRGGSPGSSLLLDVAYLVPVDAEAGFLAAADQLRADLAGQRLTLDTTGPWPPYSFATLSEDSDGA